MNENPHDDNLPSLWAHGTPLKRRRETMTIMYSVDGCDVIADFGDGPEIINRRATPAEAAEHAAYLNWRHLVEHPPYPLPHLAAADAAAEEAAHAA